MLLLRVDPTGIITANHPVKCLKGKRRMAVEVGVKARTIQIPGGFVLRSGFKRMIISKKIASRSRFIGEIFFKQISSFSASSFEGCS